MAVVRPFRALRPQKNMASKIAALPYDVYTKEEARAAARDEPDSFLKIDRAETQFPSQTDMYCDAVYKKAASTLQDMVKKEQFFLEERPCFYLYELTRKGKSQTGLACCVSVDEYDKGIIRRHENTRADKEDDRTRHIEACNAQTGPVFLAYRSREAIDELIKEEKKNPPEYDFISADGIGHKLWVIQKRETIDRIMELFEGVGRLYIADGHHRAAAAARVAKIRRKKNDPADNKAESEFFLAAAFPDKELTILGYDRLVRDLNGLTAEEFLRRLKENFYAENAEKAFRPLGKGEFAMYLEHKWYLLKAKRKARRAADAAANLDVSVLQDEVLCPILGIKEPRTDARISFIGGNHSLEELEKSVDADGGAAFVLHPTSVEELFATADEGKLMPPKSTWFEPKLRSGLLIHQI